MPESKYDPVRDLMAIRDNLAKAINQGLKVSSSFPAVDVYETTSTVIIETEPLPGADLSSIDVSMEGDVLIISGETKPLRQMPDEAYLIQEITYGPFTRSIQIPRAVQATQATARFKNNILTVTLPKAGSESSDIIGMTPTV